MPSSKVIRPTTGFGRLCLAVFTGLAFGVTASHPAMAQKHRREALPEQAEENHMQEVAKWHEQFTNPANEPDIMERLRAGYQQLRQMDNSPALKVASSAAWVPVAFSQAATVSGRATGVAFDPNDPKTIYLATAQGGVWKTTDAGKNWVSLSDAQWETLAMGAIAVDPNHPNIIYAATGDPTAAYVGSNKAGIGTYKSIDGGLNWTLIGTTVPNLVNQVFVSPDSSNLVYEATNRGIYRSSDAGDTWSQVCGMSALASMVIDPNDASTIYAAGAGVVKKSTDYGHTWSTVYTISGGNLMTIAMSKQNSQKVYVSVGTSAGKSEVIRTTDAGDSWTVMSTGPNYLGQQGWYANAIAVNPGNSEDIIVGGLDIYRSTNGGKTLTQKTDWTAYSTNTAFTHADIHVLTYNGATLYSLTDGGIYYSNSYGEAWSQDMNKTLGTFQFVGGDASPNMDFFAAGAQDNGVNGITKGDPYWKEIRGGDGGTAFVGQSEGQIVYSTYLGAVLYRSDDRGQSWRPGPYGDGNILDRSDITGEGVSAGYMEYSVCEADPNVVAICGGRNVYLTVSGGDDDFPSVTSSSPFGPKCVHVSKADPNIIYAGANNALYYSQDQGNSWTRTTSKIVTPTAITTDPLNPLQVYVTVAGTNSYHFYMSTDGGVTFTHPATNLPSLNYHRIAAAPNGQIFVGSDFGVLRSADSGVTWYPINEGLPKCQITSLQVRGNGQYLVAATYGRGMYYIDLSQLPPLPTGGVSTPSAQASAAQITAVYPNPVLQTSGKSNLQFSTKADGRTMVRLTDELGRDERVLANEWMSAGSHELSLDLAGVRPGHHFIVLTSGGTTATKAVTVE